MLIEIPGRIGGEEHTLVVEVDYYPGDPGCMNGPPEYCYPPEGDAVDVLRVGVRLLELRTPARARVHWLRPHTPVEYDDAELYRLVHERLAAEAEAAAEQKAERRDEW